MKTKHPEDIANPHRKQKPIAVGDTFHTNSGIAIVIAYGGCRKVSVRFKLTGTEKVCRSSQLRLGTVRDEFAPSLYGEGYSGGGRYQVNGAFTEAGQKWENMMKRCYFKAAQQPSYANATVCSEWKNYKTFEDWYNRQPNISQGFQLDSDLLPFLNGCHGPKLYSPENCTLLPQTLNLKLAKVQARLSQLAKARSVHPSHARLPVGVRFDVRHQNYRVTVNGKTVATRKRLSNALDMYEQRILIQFVLELEKSKHVLASNVITALETFKERNKLNLQSSDFPELAFQ